MGMSHSLQRSRTRIGGIDPWKVNDLGRLILVFPGNSFSCPIPPLTTWVLRYFSFGSVRLCFPFSSGFVSTRCVVDLGRFQCSLEERPAITRIRGVGDSTSAPGSGGDPLPPKKKKSPDYAKSMRSRAKMGGEF